MSIKKHNYEYISPGKASILVDGQFGSTGKGLLAAYLALQSQNEVHVAVTNASANAGHTTRFENGDGFVCYHLPTFGVIQPDCLIYLNAGAIINADVLLKEIEEMGVQNRIYIHPKAAIISESDINIEKDVLSSTTKLASTQKGVGEALSNKIRRKAVLAEGIDKLKPFINRIDLNERLEMGSRVSIEVPQGYSLSINGLFYPHCTSRNCTVNAGLLDANVHPKHMGKVSMSLRTYPIRVGHIFDDDGNIIGNSGPSYNDQYETSWNELGVEPEITTVTGRIRRVFSWSRNQFLCATRDNRPDVLFLNFVNYMNYKNAIDLEEMIHNDYFSIMKKEPEMLYGFGPNAEDVTDDINEFSSTLVDYEL